MPLTFFFFLLANCIKNIYIHSLQRIGWWNVTRSDYNYLLNGSNFLAEQCLDRETQILEGKSFCLSLNYAERSRSTEVGDRRRRSKRQTATKEIPLGADLGSADSRFLLSPHRTGPFSTASCKNTTWIFGLRRYFQASGISNSSCES